MQISLYKKKEFTKKTLYCLFNIFFKDRDWNDEFDASNVGNHLLTNALARDSLPNGHSGQIVNGYSSLNRMEEESESHSNLSGVLSPSRIKVEPLDSLDDDYDSAKVSAQILQNIKQSQTN